MAAARESSLGGAGYPLPRGESFLMPTANAVGIAPSLPDALDSDPVIAR